MIDCNDDCSFYDGDNDNYHLYEPNLGGVYSGRPKKQFIKDNNYYHRWISFDKKVERETCYSILIKDTWMNIPKKIVREMKDTNMLVHLRTFDAIETAAIEKQFGL